MVFPFLAILLILEAFPCFVCDLDEDKESSLIEIIPGLQRLGKKVDEAGQKATFDESSVSRPYLSEAWDVLEKKVENPLTSWRIPAFGNEMELKGHLRFWAQTVASTVR